MAKLPPPTCSGAAEVPSTVSTNIAGSSPTDFAPSDPLIRETSHPPRSEGERSLIPSVPTTPINKFRARRRSVAELRIPCGSRRMHVIEALDSEFIIRRRVEEPLVVGGEAVSDPTRDFLKIAVVNRYEDAPAALAAPPRGP